MLLRRGLARPEIAFIVNIYTVSNGSVAVGVAIVLHQLEQSVLAMKAARGIIANVFWIFKLIGLNDLAGNLLLLGKTKRVFELGAGKTVGIGNKREHLSTQRFMRSKSQEGGIDTPGVGHQQAPGTAQVGIEKIALGVQIH